MGFVPCSPGPSLRKPLECESDAAADVVFLVDGSWSIGRTNFRRVREFLEDLMAPFHIGPKRIQIGESQKTRTLVLKRPLLGVRTLLSSQVVDGQPGESDVNLVRPARACVSCCMSLG